MDSRPPEDPKPDADQTIAIHLLKLFAPAEVASETDNKLREGGLGYGDLKKTLFEHYWEYFAEARAQRAELENNLDHVNQVLKEGAKKARARHHRRRPRKEKLWVELIANAFQQKIPSMTPISSSVIPRS